MQDGEVCGLVRYDGIAMRRSTYDSLRAEAIEGTRKLTGPLGSQALSAAVAS